MTEINVCELKHFQEIRQEYLEAKSLAAYVDRFGRKDCESVVAGPIYGEISIKTNSWVYSFDNKYDEYNYSGVSNDVGSVLLDSLIRIDKWLVGGDK